MNPYLSKAVRARHDAHALMQAGSPDGAANRAYYAMFNAARAALDVRTGLKVEDIRRHSAVLQLFSLHVVKPGLVSAKLSADINEAFQARAIADYARASVTKDDARQLIRLMEEMLESLGQLLGPEAEQA